MENELFQNSPLELGNPFPNSQHTESLPIDRGESSGLFELGYVPTQTSVPVVLALAVCAVGVFSWWYIYKRNILSFVSFLCIVACSLMMLGPIRTPSLLGISTTIGVGKAIAAGILCFVLLRALFKKRFVSFSTPSFIPLSLFYAYVFSSVLYTTNIENYLSDVKIIMGGLLFYYVSYLLFSSDITRRSLFVGLSIASLWSTAQTLLTLVSKSLGISLTQMAYPRYENITFLFDLSRGRILSIGDIEFAIPGIVALLATTPAGARAISLWVMFGSVLVAIFLTNYRNRALIGFLGVIITMIVVPKNIRKRLGVYVAALIIFLFGAYITVYTGIGKPTLISRFLMEDAANDRDSILRRSISFERTISMFTKFPVFGVGLGAFRDNMLVSYDTFKGRVSNPYYQILKNIYIYPHNWLTLLLAEHGLIGFVLLLYLWYSFLRVDLQLLTRTKGAHRLLLGACSTTSWLYVLSNMFTPLYTSQPMVILYWVMRGVLDRAYHDTTFQDIM